MDKKALINKAFYVIILIVRLFLIKEVKKLRNSLSEKIWEIVRKQSK